MRLHTTHPKLNKDQGDDILYMGVGRMLLIRWVQIAKKEIIKSQKPITEKSCKRSPN